MSKTEIAILDRDHITAQTLADLCCDVVIDAAGPFQTSHTWVIQAAIDASMRYFDLTEGRDFVRGITKFDAQSQAKNIAVIAGASSIPALSHAVIDALTQNWQRYDQISMGIFPGNSAPRGLSVVQSILSYVGKPVRVFRQGTWQSVTGWGLTHRIIVPLVGKRWASVCDTPDQDLLVTRYHPTTSAEFYAGLELSILHVGLWLLSWPVRWGWLHSLLPYAKSMLWVAKELLPFGSDQGGMTIAITGLDAARQPRHFVWGLTADANRGPYVPTLAALILVRQLRDGKLTFRGASPCVGLISLSEFEREFKRLGLVTSIDATALARSNVVPNRAGNTR